MTLFQPRRRLHLAGILAAVVVTSSLSASPLEQARELRAKRDYDSALRALGNAKGSAARHLRARLLLDLGAPRRAAEILEPMCTGKKPDCLNLLGVARMQLGKFPAAEATFRKALAVAEGQAESTYRSNLALALFYQKKYRLSGAAHQAALKKDPTNFSTRVNYASYLVWARRYRLAVKQLEYALKGKGAATGNRAFARLYLGYAYYRLRRYASALAQFDRGLKQNQKSFRLHYYRAHALIQVGKLDDAEAAVKRAEELKPGNNRLRILRRLIAIRRSRTTRVTRLKRMPRDRSVERTKSRRIKRDARRAQRRRIYERGRSGGGQTGGSSGATGSGKQADFRELKRRAREERRKRILESLRRKTGRNI